MTDAGEKLASSRVRELQQLMIETQRPFISAMVKVYNMSLPKLFCEKGALVKVEYPPETEATIAEIRNHMEEACKVAHVAAIRKLKE